MRPTDEDIYVLAYFEREDRRRRGADVPAALELLAAKAPSREEITSRTAFYGWLANVGGGQHALTLSGQQHLANALSARV